LQLSHQIDLRATIPAPVTRHLPHGQAETLLCIPLKPLAADFLEYRPAHVIGQARRYVGSVHGGRIGKLQVAGQGSEEAIPEGQKGVGNPIVGPAFGVFTEREFTPNPAQVMPLNFVSPPAIAARIALYGAGSRICSLPKRNRTSLSRIARLHQQSDNLLRRWARCVH